MAHLNREVGSMVYDRLIAGITPAVKVASGTIKKLATAATYIRGTVLAKSSKDGLLYILGTAAAESSQAFNGDGAAKTFTITAKPIKLSSVKVGGEAVIISSYDATTGVVTLAVAPAAGTGNVVAYYAEEVIEPYGILCDDTDIGTAANVVAAVYVAGCFDTGSLTVAEGYTMTTADKDALRNGGCYLAEVFGN